MKSNTLILGTPPQAFNVLIDTGSFQFWIRDKNCTNAQNCRNFASFNSVASSSFQSVPRSSSSSQNLLYGDGTNISCQIHQDIITVGNSDLPPSNICFANQIIASPPSSLDGIIGFGPKGNPQEGIAEFMPVFIRANPALAAQMSFWFNTNVSISSGGAGSVAIGGVDTTKFTGPITYYDILKDERVQYWALGLNAIASASGSILASFGNVRCIIDTGIMIKYIFTNISQGTTVLLLDDANTRSLNLQIGAKYDDRIGAYMLDCNSLASLSPLAFYFSGSSQPLVLSGNQLAHIDARNGVCYSVIQSSSSVGGNLIIFGAWFLKSFYTVFDYETSKIGFASPTGQLQPDVSVTIPNFSNNDSFFGKLGTSSVTLIILGVLAAVVLIIVAFMYYGKRKQTNRNSELPISVNQRSSIAVPPVASIVNAPRMVQIPPTLPVKDTAPVPPVLSKLDCQSSEFQHLVLKFQTSWKQGNSTVAIPSVISISKVSNPSSQREKFFLAESRIGYLGTKSLFHGAPKACPKNNQQPCDLPFCAVCQIVMNGFNPVETISTPKAMGSRRFGKGIYFTSKSHVANEYASVVPGQPQILLVADVLLGNQIIPATSLWTNESLQSLILEGTDFHSVYAPALSIPDLVHDEYVIGKSDQALVRYLIEYQHPGYSGEVPVQERGI